MRCLTLANELRQNGAYTCFVCRWITPFLLAQITAFGHALIVLPAVESHLGGDLMHSPWLGTSQAQDADDTLAALNGGSWDWLIVDHYALDIRWETALRPTANRILVLDDLADRPHDCDVLLDQNLRTIFTSRYD